MVPSINFDQMGKEEKIIGGCFQTTKRKVKLFFFSNFLTSAAIDFQLSVRCVRNRPIQGYRRHFVKGAKPLGRARGQTNGDAFTMPKHARCCVGFCDNEKRFPNLLVVRSHVKELKSSKSLDIQAFLLLVSASAKT